MEEKRWIVKAAGDWELDVLGIPFYGPDNGKDKDGEYFDARTNLHQDKYPLPPVVYYHGYDGKGRPSKTPVYIGKTESYEVKPDGVWYRVILDKASSFARGVMQAAKEGLARASSGSVSHLARVDSDGHIREWPVAELSIFDTYDGKQPANAYAVAIPVAKAVYKLAGLDLPDEFAGIENPEDAIRDSGEQVESKTLNTEDIKMTDKTEAEIKAEARAEFQAELDKKAAEEKRVSDAIADGIKAKVKELEDAAELAKKAQEFKDKEEAEARRLPDVKFNKLSGEVSKYDNLTAGDTAVLLGVIQSGGKQMSDAGLKALALKMEDDKTDVGIQGTRALKSRGIKTDEVQYSTLSGYGDQWVGVAYSNALWSSIRTESQVVAKIPSIEVPAGHESITIPLQGADPTYYKVAQVADVDSTNLIPVPTITSSQMATSNVSLTLAKMGARVMWSGELEEDSLIPFVNQLRMQLADAGKEQLEYAVIDGDTTATAATNINDIASTAVQTATELHLMFNGFRKSPLVTTAANSRSGGALTAEDYLATAKLMGTAGQNADINKVSFIVDLSTYWKSLELPEVKTRDVFVSPTIENGQLTGIYGFKLFPSMNMCYKSAARLSNSSGKVDQDVVGNNIYGSILAVRWDQWLMGYRRRMTMETTRIANADTYEIVALARMGLIQRDTEASAISYGITV